MTVIHGFRHTLGARAAEEIRRRILSMEPGFRPGDRLYLLDLVQRLDVSTTPVREAINLLAAEGLLELLPRRGARVVMPSSSDLDDLLSVRAGLEAMALQLGPKRFTEQQCSALSAYLDVCERAIAVGDIPMWHANDESFHRAMVAASGSPRLLRLYDTLLGQARLFMAIYIPSRPGMLKESLREHRELVRQLAHGDAARSQRALAVHWEHSRARLQKKYDALVTDRLRMPSEASAPEIRSSSVTASGARSTHSTRRRRMSRRIKSKT